jgi:hypothetical protein
MTKLTPEREIAPCVWVHPDDDDRALTVATELDDAWSSNRC